MYLLSLQFGECMFTDFGIYVFDLEHNPLAEDTYFKGNNNFLCVDGVRFFTESLV